MASPKAIVQTLNEYFDLIERLALKSRSSNALYEQAIFDEAVAYFQQNKEDALRAFRVLVKNGILRPIDQDGAYIIQKYTKDYVLNLVKEQKLGLAEIVKVEADRVGKLSDEVQKALEKGDLALVQSKASMIIDLIDEIQNHLESDRNAIKNIIERAKIMPPDTPLNLRYGEVSDCFEQYVEPMRQFLGNDATGFLNLTLTIEKQLARGMDLCNIQAGSLSSWSRTMKGAQSQIRMLRTQIRENLALFQNELAPLRNRVTKNNRISCSVVALLAKVRKKGLRKSLNVKPLKLGKSQRDVRFSLSPSVKEFSAKVLQYTPAKFSFPEELVSSNDDLMLLRIDDVIENLRMCKRRVLLMEWLKENYPEQSDRTLLSVYQQILQRESKRLRQSDSRESTNLKNYRITYYPHILENAV